MSDVNPDKSQQPDEPRIIVDEDWKTQVEAEKKAAEEAKTKPEADPQNAGAPSADADLGPFPDASFPMLVTTLATQATVALGQPVTPDAKQGQVDLGLAKHLIDTLGILEEKTQGNLTPDETRMLTEVLYQLRMAFVTIQSQAKEAAPGSEAAPKSSSIELP